MQQPSAYGYPNVISADAIRSLPRQVIGAGSGTAARRRFRTVRATIDLAPTSGIAIGVVVGILRVGPGSGLLLA